MEESLILRSHQPGDIGWVIHMHGKLYAEEYGWNEEFEAMVAQIGADFLTHYNPHKEHSWIAELDGEIVGSVFVVQESESVAKLRLLVVDPKARGFGLGSQLVDECIHFAKESGYKKLVLWTNSVLTAARNIYRKAGFTMVEQTPYRGYGQDLVSEVWELTLF